MNSDNEQNSDILYQQLLHWLQNPETEATATDRPATSDLASSNRGQIRSPVDPVESMIEWQAPEFSDTQSSFDAQLEDPLTWELEDLDLDPDLNESASAQSSQSFDMGEIPIVQKRFQAILKRKLQAEIERHPPLFPWETEMVDYQMEYADEVPAMPNPSRQLWIPQLVSMLPMSVPDTVLSQLLDLCTEGVATLQSPVAQLVNAVKPLFPDHLHRLNQVANQIRLSPNLASSRLSRGDREAQRQALTQALPESYEAGTPEQQMAMTLLAAREILEALTLTVSSQNQSSERQWRTTAGLVWLKLHYNPDNAVSAREPLKISARLPKGGSLSIKTDRETAQAERIYPGFLTVELFDWQPGERYAVEVSLNDRQHQPLQFMAVCQ
ncbi:MAG: hypothetical protein ACLFT0_19795 [Spirulinaceae cyanobacterium]